MANLDLSGFREQPSTILTPEGVPAVIPRIELDLKDVELLRQYKKFLQRMGLREALYCNECWSGERSDGCEAFVTDVHVLVKCRCKERSYFGQTF
jgi:hypothetical protein